MYAKWQKNQNSFVPIPGQPWSCHMIFLATPMATIHSFNFVLSYRHLFWMKNAGEIDLFWCVNERQSSWQEHNSPFTFTRNTTRTEPFLSGLFRFTQWDWLMKVHAVRTHTHIQVRKIRVQRSWWTTIRNLGAHTRIVRSCAMCLAAKLDKMLSQAASHYTHTTFNHICSILTDGCVLPTTTTTMSTNRKSPSRFWFNKIFNNWFRWLAIGRFRWFASILDLGIVILPIPLEIGESNDALAISVSVQFSRNFPHAKCTRQFPESIDVNRMSIRSKSTDEINFWKVF